MGAWTWTERKARKIARRELLAREPGTEREKESFAGNRLGRAAREQACSVERRETIGNSLGEPGWKERA